MTINSDCPACQSSQLSGPLYELSDVPVQSVRLVDSPQAARNFPVGSLTLVHCTSCGLVFNRNFEPETQVWDSAYEETQACSAHFSQFSRNLAEELIARWQLRNKRVLEVGCGKGHFLSELCRIGDNIGMGVDPALDLGRLADAPESVTFHQALFHPKHMQFDPDLIVCRHTLEHLVNPQEVLSIMASRRDIEVFFDVPDLQRILKEGAFWDLYYEHCNYFDRNALAGLLHRFGFIAEEIRSGFEGHYLMYFGRSAGTPGKGSERKISGKTGSEIQNSRNSWIHQLRQWRENGKSVVLWGGGSKAVGFLSGVGSSAASTVEAVVDINPHKQGRFLPGTGHPVLAPEQLPENAPDHIVILNPVYRPEVSSLLQQLDVKTCLTDVNRISL